MFPAQLKSYISSIELRSIVVGISLLLFLSPILYFSALNNPSHVPRIAFLSIISTFICFIYFFSLLKNEKKIYFHKIHILVLLLLTWATVSISWTIDYGNFAYEIIPLWALVGLFFVASQVSSFKNIKIFLTVSIFGALYAAVIGLMQNYGLNPVGYRFDPSIMNSTFGFKNHAALYMDLIIPVSLVMAIITENKIFRWLLTIIAGILVGFTLELHTRGSWLVLVIWSLIFICYLYIDSRGNNNILSLLKIRYKEILFILVTSGIIFGSHGIIDEKWQRPVQEGEMIDTSSSDRLRFYYNSLNVIKDKPLTGVGYGAFWKGFRKYTNKPLVIKRSNASLYVYRLHNDPLQYFVEL
ncbi:MAG: O-antigen ligase family protein, partial [Gammaproteobacteria bacterium]